MMLFCYVTKKQLWTQIKSDIKIENWVFSNKPTINYYKN